MSEDDTRQLCAYLAVSTGFGYGELQEMELDELARWVNEVNAMHAAGHGMRQLC